MPMTDTEQSLSLIVRRVVRGSAVQVFRAWTDPAQLRQWWGPAGVRCIDAQIDLRVGGHYRIGNQLPDGSEIWIEGVFERIEPPHLIAFSWSRVQTKANRVPAEKVCIRFVERTDGTEVIVEHTRIADRTTFNSHEIGWHGCLDGFASHQLHV